MAKFLLDANLSHETAKFLRHLGFDVQSVSEEGLGGILNVQVARLAYTRKRVLITFDLDFGEMYHFGKFRGGVIILRLRDQTVESVNKILASFLKSKVLERERNFTS